MIEDVREYALSALCESDKIYYQNLCTMENRAECRLTIWKKTAIVLDMHHVSVHAFREILEGHASDPKYDFLDVCTPEEFREKHIDGVRNVPMDRIPSVLNSLQGKSTIFLQCRSGRRSEYAAGLLEQFGVSAEIVQVDGGLLAWETAGFPVRRDE